jgi:DnaJ-class molecular chaperone
MYDLAVPAESPGRCPKCRGTGEYRWGGTVNGKPGRTGTCFSCRGSGRQDARQIARNHTYNRYKIAAIAAEMTG